MWNNCFITQFDIVYQIKNKENWKQDKTICALSLHDTEDYIANHSKGVKKSRFMNTTINFLKKKSTTSENIKQKILELKQEKIKLKKELIVLKEILQQLHNTNDLISIMKKELIDQYLTTDL